MTDASSQWIGVLSFIGGFAVKSVTDWLQDRRVAKRDREAREDARRTSLNERNAEFQRENLLALQEALMRLMRATGQTHHSDVMAFRRDGTWQQTKMPDGVAEAGRLGQADTTTIMVRIRDQRVRELTASAKALANEAANCANESVSYQLLNKLALLHEELNGRIGEVLRELAGGDAAEANSTRQFPSH